jgi:hypothetical protein
VYGVCLIGLVAALGLAGCAKASDPTSSALGAGALGGSSSGSNHQQGEPESGDDACTSCSSSGGGSGSGSGGGSAVGSDDASPSGDDATVGDDSAAPPTGDDGGTAPPFMFPPISLPDGGSTSTGDGGANACTTKICIDPVFDCPLQGCFNGCMNFFCQ